MREVWWCEDRGNAHVMLAAYGERTWVDQCIPHIDWPRRPLHGRELLEEAHSGCGPMLVIPPDSLMSALIAALETELTAESMSVASILRHHQEHREKPL